MTEKKAFDAKSITHIDKHLRKLVDEQYDLCLFKCAERGSDAMAPCKDACFKRVIVLYRFHNHASRDQEENLYRKCLSAKLPNLTPEHYIECTHNLYADRLEILSKYMLDVSQKVLSELH